MLVQIPASEIEPCLGGKLISPHNVSNQRRSDAPLWWKEKTASNRKQHVGRGCLGCCLGACGLSVTFESPRDRCSSLMSLKGRIRGFCFFFLVGFFPPGQPCAIHPTHGSVLQSWNKWHSKLQRTWKFGKFPLDENVNDRPLTWPSWPVCALCCSDNVVCLQDILWKSLEEKPRCSRAE